jgi:lipopolysaccharide export system protein LptC
MSNYQSALRFRLAVIIALSAFLALSSFWLSTVIKRSAVDSTTFDARTDPDYLVFNFDYLKMLPNGQPHYHLSGKKLTHYPGDDSYKIDSPVYKSLDPSRPPQTARANTAVLQDENTKVHMYGNVVGDRSATPSAAPLNLQTEYLLVFPDEDAMQTDKPVTIRRGNVLIEGVGMYANNATGELRLHNQTSVLIAPKK